MRLIYNSLIISIIFICQLASAASPANSYKNWYAIAWEDTATNSVRYAKSMGYEYFALKGNSVTPAHYDNMPASAGLSFYIINPHRWWRPPYIPGLQGEIIYTDSFTGNEINWMNNYGAWGTNTAFPYNLAGAGGASPTKIVQMMFNLQDQIVIDYLCTSTVALAQSYENLSRDFKFAGVIIDEPRLTGDFYYWNTATSAAVATGIPHWTGTTSTLEHGTVTNEYAVWNDGLAAWYKQMSGSLTAIWSDYKWVIAPYWIYNSGGGVNVAEWVYTVSQRSDKGSLTPHVLSQEGEGMFFQNPNIFNSGMAIDYTMVNVSQPENYGESYLRTEIIRLAGTMAAFSGWFGLFSQGTGGGGYTAITEIPDRIKLIKCIGNWDNLYGIATSTRSVGSDNGTISYHAAYANGNPRSHINNHVMWSRPWGTQTQIYASFGTNSAIGSITIASTEAFVSASYVNTFFEPSTDATSDFTVNGNVISLAPGVTVTATSWTGYIIELGTASVSGTNTTNYSGGVMTYSGGAMTLQ